MYKQFQTDANLEKAGVDLDYGDFIVTIARAGGANKRFEKVLEAKTKSVKRAIQTDTLDNERGKAILRDVYAEAVVLKWAVKVKADAKGKPLEPLQVAQEGDEHTVFVEGIEGPNGDVMAASTENIAATFKALPDLFADIQEQAQKVALFRQAVQEAEAKN
jgi:hypothetical protein